jgi:hypothetical protein
MNKFLQELINGGSEELYNCVGVKFPDILEGKVGECFRACSSTTRDLSNVSRSLMRDLQGFDKRNLVVFVTPNLRMYMCSIGRYLTENQKKMFSLFRQNEDKLQ